MQQYQDEIGITVVPFQEMVYVPEMDAYWPVDEIQKGMRTLSIFGTELRRMLFAGEQIPTWFSYPEVIEELVKAYPPRIKQGFTLFCTGLSGAGKSMLVNALALRLTEIQDKRMVILDGDIVRNHLSKGLGFTKEDRQTNIRRIGYVASEITKVGGITLVAAIAPYKEDREYVRSLIEDKGGFIEIYVSTPLAVCEERDAKGLYQKAREGIIQHFTGISDPYEAPCKPEITIDTSLTSIEEAVDGIITYLLEHNYIALSKKRSL